MNFCSVAAGRGDASAAALLQVALRMARKNQMVSDFLFENLLESIFHKEYTLAPTALATSSTIQIKQTSRLESALTSTTCPPWLSTWIDGTVTVNVNTLYVPVVSAPPYVLGYVWFAEVPNNPSCFPASPFAPPCISRYTFDTSSGELLIVTHGGEPACFGIFTIQCGLRCDRPQLVLGVPAAPYEWPHLPTIVLWTMTSMEAGQLQNIVHSSTVGNDDNGSHLVFRTQLPRESHDANHGRQNGFSTSSGQELRGDEILPISGGVVAKRTPPVLQACLSKMISMMTGCFEFQGFRFSETAAGYCGTSLPYTLFGQCNLLISAGNIANSVRIRERFAYTCYKTALSPITDRHLLTTPALTSVRSTQCHDLVSSASATLQRATSLHNDRTADNILFGERNELQNLLDPLYSSNNLHDLLPFSGKNDCDSQSGNELLVGQGCEQIDGDDQNKSESGGNIFTGGSDRNSAENARKVCNVPGTAVASASAGNIITTSHLQRSVSTLLASSGGSLGYDPEASEAKELCQILPRCENMPNLQRMVTPLFLHSTPLAPRPDAHTPPDRHSQESILGNVPDVTDSQKRRNVIEARRRRNRLSAARSNERKRQLIADLQRETEEGKRKVAELSARKAAIQSDNERLRAQIHNRKVPFD